MYDLVEDHSNDGYAEWFASNNPIIGMQTLIPTRTIAAIRTPSGMPTGMVSGLQWYMESNTDADWHVH